MVFGRLFKRKPAVRKKLPPGARRRGERKKAPPKAWPPASRRRVVPGEPPRSKRN